ncbi:reverse transcriptase domain-containing protein [Tanacetum coccineum]|uniref:Reverse transcriptase domain-containing protein n=2 Tax=Tanacetum coccineum TaxID=301880 RepID=A0ABQ4YF11_9ASTR
MRTRSQSRNLHNQQHQAPPPVVEPFNLEEPFENPPPPPPPMDDQRTMAQLLEAPTAGYEDAIVVPEITADNFELKHGLLNLVQNKQFFGHDKEDPHAHIRYFNKITSTMKFPNVPSTSVKLMLFPFSLEGAARIWLEKEPPRSIQTWDDLVSKFINKFFPPSKTTNLRNEITRFQQRFDETFYEAWDRFNDLLRACPHHGFSELHQLDTFYNALNSNDQDSLNSAAGGNFLDKMPRDCLRIIESKSKVRNSRNKPVVAKVSASTSTPGISSEVAELKDMVKALLLDKKNQSPAPTPVKAVEESCVTCGGAHSYQTCPATSGNVYRDNIQEYVSQAAAANFNQGNTGYRAPISNQIRPPGFPPVQNNHILLLTLYLIKFVLEFLRKTKVASVHNRKVFHGWAYAFHQDKASLVRVPVANVTLTSLAHLLRENTDSVRSNQRMRNSLYQCFLLGLSAFAMVVACASRAAIIPSVMSCWMAANVMAGVSDVDVLLGGILST